LRRADPLPHIPILATLSSWLGSLKALGTFATVMTMGEKLILARPIGI